MGNTSWSGNRRSFPTATRKQIMDRDEWRCQIRGEGCLGEATQADHIKNWAEGGTDDAANGQAACAECHKHKTAEERKRGMQKRSRYRQPMSHPGMGASRSPTPGGLH